MSFRGTPPEARSSSTRPVAIGEANRDDQLPVTGIVNRVKVPNTHEWRAVVTDPSIKTVMLPIDSARKLVELHSETARTYFRDDQTVITTTTIHDDILRKLDWGYELEIVRQFGPDYHIPTEYSVYQSMTRSEQAQAITDCMDGTEWFSTRLENHSTTVLLQAKGWLPWHYERCRPTMKRLDKDFLVFYAAGYEGRVYELKEDLEALVSVLKPSGILVIGQQSVRFLSKTLPEVVAAAGCRWRRQSGLEEDGHDPQQHKRWKGKVEQYLATGQAILSSYEIPQVKENG